MYVVDLETLYERAVEQRRMRRGNSLVRSPYAAVSAVVDGSDALDRDLAVLLERAENAAAERVQDE